MRNRFCATLVLAIASTATASPQLQGGSGSPPPYCETAALGTEVGSDAYAFRDGNRCEGLYRLKLSGGSRRFVLRSLTSDRSDGALVDQPELQVSWPPLPAGVRLRISVVPLDSPILYRMDTEADGAVGSFKWPARIARGRFSRYSNLGVVASYVVGNDTVYVACALGLVSGAASARVRADILSLEPIRRLEVFSRPCKLSAGDCGSLGAGSLIAALPGQDRDGTFTINIPSLGPTPSDFYGLRFAGQIANAESPSIATSLILHAPAGAPTGSAR